jgi:hypothetical protein
MATVAWHMAQELGEPSGGKGVSVRGFQQGAPVEFAVADVDSLFVLVPGMLLAPLLPFCDMLAALQ